MTSSPQQILLDRIDTIDENDVRALTDAKPGEYFAVLCLATIGELYSRHLETGIRPGLQTDLVAEATESLAIAEGMLGAELMLQDASRRTGRQGLDRRYAALREIKQRFHAWCLNSYLPRIGGEPFKANEAAECFLLEVIEPSLLATKDPEERMKLEKLDGLEDPVRALVESLPKPFPPVEQNRLGLDVSPDSSNSL